MALKDKVQKRLDGMKVEGSWRMKLAVYGGAVLMVGFILAVMYLLLGQVHHGKGCADRNPPFGTQRDRGQRPRSGV